MKNQNPQQSNHKNEFQGGETGRWTSNDAAVKGRLDTTKPDFLEPEQDIYSENLMPEVGISPLRMTFQIKSTERLSGGISDMFSDKHDKDKSNAQTNSINGEAIV